VGRGRDKTKGFIKRKSLKVGVYGPLLMKQKKGGEICFVIYIAGERKIFVFIYEVIVKQNYKKRSANHYSHMPVSSRYTTSFIRAPRTCASASRVRNRL
jgi:hypothetical protein